jgi:L-ascorbate metabolism protein UlaG (beta-lactamase superfamily)
MQVPELAEKLVWLGHDAFRVDAGKTVYIDPYEVPPGPGADLILITHEHFDHCSLADVAKVQQADTVIVTEKDSAAKLKGDVRIMKPGDIITAAGMQISAVPAYNIDKHFHPREKNWLGFIIDIEGVRLYHAGDTDFIPEMKELNVDIALLPVSGTYVMTAEEAIEAAMAIGPKLAVPMHFGSIVGGQEDAARFKAALAGEVDVLIPPKG